MEFQELVESRRSTRKFQESSISVEELEQILLCAQEAPSWKNSQTGRYYVITDREKLDEVRNKALPFFNANSSQNAAALIVTTFEANDSGFNPDGTATNEIGNEWGAYDLGIQNILLCLKAKELGYDSLIMGIRDTDVLRSELRIPESQHVVAVIAIGKGDAPSGKPPRKPLDEIATFF